MVKLLPHGPAVPELRPETWTRQIIAARWLPEGPAPGTPPGQALQPLLPLSLKSADNLTVHARVNTALS